MCFLGLLSVGRRLIRPICPAQSLQLGVPESIEFSSLFVPVPASTGGTSLSARTVYTAYAWGPRGAIALTFNRRQVVDADGNLYFVFAIFTKVEACTQS